jgi:hypothetical protein
MHAARSDLNTNPNNLDMKLLNFMHFSGSGNSAHSAQLIICFFLQHERTLHQVAREFSWHPLHFPTEKDLQAPQ